MDGKRLLVLAIVAAGAFYLYTHRGTPAPATPAAAGAASAWDAGTCVRLAEAANEELHQAGLLLTRPPVDAGAFGAAEQRVQSALSSADSACAGATSEKDQQTASEVRAALSAIRSQLSDYSGAARGSGGATSAAQRQEEIEGHLDRARTLLRS